MITPRVIQAVQHDFAPDVQADVMELLEEMQIWAENREDAMVLAEIDWRDLLAGAGYLPD